MATVPLLRTPGCFYTLSSAASSRPFLLCNLRLSSSPPPLLSLRKRCPITPSFAASTSEWAQQEEDEKLGWVNGDSYGDEEIDGDEQGDAAGDGFAEESYPEPPEEAKLFVGNLPFDVDSEGLAKLFDQAGVVEVAEVIYNRQTDQSRGFGFVSMRTVEEAEKAVEMLNGYEYNGRLLNVNKASPRGSRPERPPREYTPLSRIYVGNLPWQVDDARLAQVFSEHGTVVSARVVYDRDSGRSRGFGFVTMSTQAELDDAIASLDGQTLDGRAIRVNIAEERPRR